MSCSGGAWSTYWASKAVGQFSRHLHGSRIADIFGFHYFVHATKSEAYRVAGSDNAAGNKGRGSHAADPLDCADARMVREGDMLCGTARAGTQQIVEH